MNAVANLSWDCRVEEVVAVVERRLKEVMNGSNA
jgi:hypothetical protein